MKIVLLLLAGILILMACFGLWNFVNSRAAEAQMWKIVDTFTAGAQLLFQGIFAILLGAALGTLVFLTGKGAINWAKAGATYMLASRATQLVIPGSAVETPEITIYPPARIIGQDQRLLTNPGDYDTI